MFVNVCGMGHVVGSVVREPDLYKKCEIEQS